MKNILSLAAAVTALALTTSALAYSPIPAAPQSAAPALKLVPQKVVNPTKLPLSFERQVIDVEFSLDEAGQPRDIKVLSKSDRAVKEQVVKAFRQWKFEAVRATDAATTRFVLPLDIIPEA